MGIEFLQVAEAVAREKNIDKEQVLEVMESAIAMGARRKFGMDLNVDATLDRLSGEVTLKKLQEVVEVVMEPVSPDEIRLAARENRDPEMQPALDENGKPVQESANQIVLKEAKKQNKDITLGEFIIGELPPMDFGRIAAQAAKQVIVQKVRDVERGHEFEEYQDSVGQIISGIVKRVEYHGTYVDLGKAEAFLPREEIIQRETFRVNDRVRAYVYKVEQRQRGPQIFISRTHPQFLAKLFAEEVPEIANDVIEVLAVSRDPGFRAKMAVKSSDRNMDPVGACVGIRGVRVQAVTTELQGERVDIIEWSADPATFLVRAMAPAEVTKVVVDEAEGRMEVVVPEDKLSQAIGRRGQNVRLASILTGWDIDVMTEQEESERRAAEFSALSQSFMQKLDVDETLARLLIGEGFSGVEDLLKISTGELAGIEGFDEGIATELQNRAEAAVTEQTKRLQELKVQDDLVTLPGLNTDILVHLAENKVVTRDDLADLATDELQEMLPAGTLTDKQAERMIMEARKHWFANENSDEETAEDEASAEAAPAATTTEEAAQATA